MSVTAIKPSSRMRMLAAVAGLPGVLFPLVCFADLEKTVDAAGREMSVFSGSTASLPVEDAVAREFAVFAGSTTPFPITDAPAREFSVFAGFTGPVRVADSVAREFSVFVGMPAPVVRDAASREFSVMAGGAPFVPVRDAVAREFSVLVPTTPVITLNPSPLSYLEGDGVVVIDEAALVEDPDSTHFEGGYLRVEFMEGGSPGDALTILEVDGGLISLSGGEVLFDGVSIGIRTGGLDGEPLLVSFNANATVAAAEALVRSIAFSNPGRFPPGGLRSVGFALSDGDAGEGPVATRGIMVTPVNHAPVAGPDFLGVARDVPLVFSVAVLLANDSDPDGDPLELTLPAEATAQGGEVVLAGGMVTYSPPPGFTGTDHFTYTLGDPFGGVDTGMVTAYVRAPDDPSVSILEMVITETGAFQLALIGLPGREYEGLASGDLVLWTPIGLTETGETGGMTFLDEEAGLFERRFYRFRFP